MKIINDFPIFVEMDNYQNKFFKRLHVDMPYKMWELKHILVGNFKNPIYMGYDLQK